VPCARRTTRDQGNNDDRERFVREHYHRSDHAPSLLNGRASSPDETLPSRAAPHNLEAEQALLGAILFNNEAHDRVSGFLEAHHFYDPLHGQIYETAAKLITSGKQATPITLRTFFEESEPIHANQTVPQYLGWLAVNAATRINARDYGGTIHDLATRRQLILIGEDMVNVAFDSPVDFPPKEQIEDAETRLIALRDADKDPHVRERCRSRNDWCAIDQGCAVERFKGGPVRRKPGGENVSGNRHDICHRSRPAVPRQKDDSRRCPDSSS
jgi:DnaB-like helicase N terminal domain